MVASMVAFSAEDVLLKLAGSAAPLSHVMVLFGVFGMVFFAVLCIAKRQSPFTRAIWHPSIVLRFWFEVFGRLFFTLSLVLTALSSTVAILQAAPLVVVAGAAFLFHERVSIGRWIGIFVGLIGVALILRPATTDFSAMSLLAVLGMLGLALRDLATRAAPRTIPNAVLGFHSFASVAAAGLVYSIWEGVPAHHFNLLEVATLVAAAVAGGIGYVALTEAMRTGDISVVTPFRYTRLICGAVIGVVIFGETLDAIDIVGAALIIGSGTFVLLRCGRQAVTSDADIGKATAKAQRTGARA